MNKIVVTPYSEIDNKIYNTLEVEVQTIPFQNVVPKVGQMVFTFSNCLIKEIEIINNQNVNFKDVSIYFIDCVIEKLTVKDFVSPNISLAFSSCILSGNINCKNLLSLNLNNVIINQTLFITDIQTIDISYTEENIFVKRWLWLIDQIKTDYKTLLQTKQQIHIFYPQRLSLRFNEIERETGVYREKFDSKQIKYALPHSEKELLSVSLSIHFGETNSIDSKVNITDCYLTSLSLSKKGKGEINIEDTKVDQIYIRDFEFSGQATLYNIAPFHLKDKKNQIEVHKSNLNGFSFERIRFTQYQTISFYRSKFDGARITSCDFPIRPADFSRFKSLQNVHYAYIEPSNYYKDQYEIFLQIKTLLEKSGNFHEALKMNAVANEALRKTDDIDNVDRTILSINSWTNYHGLSLIRPILGFIFFSILFYLSYLYSLGRIFTDTEFDSSLIGYYFSFIDITHRSDFLVDRTDFNAMMLTLDFFNKLIIGFFIYQFIAAFRKYGKK